MRHRQQNARGDGAWAGAGPPTPPFPPPPERARPAPVLTTTEGFTAFYREHVDAVLGFVTRRVTDPNLAADLTADVFVAALEAAPGYRPDKGVPIAWLYGIARHVLAGHARGSARERGALSRLSGRRLLDEEDLAALEERIDAERAARALALRHRALSEPLRAVLDLMTVDGLNQAETAQALGISRATVRVRLHRARRLLRADDLRADAAGPPISGPLPSGPLPSGPLRPGPLPSDALPSGGRPSSSRPAASPALPVPRRAAARTTPDPLMESAP
ncbi:hypothetical protein GCM10009665_02740 [Kitasatospora nipponensis]|uniref:RNA polymerase sigma-70 factor (ECF subfamily) n=1 Tax=Kitasatospora nipponensis TaxID=258049 RepID=A0ABN1VQ23_9ACTN